MVISLELGWQKTNNLKTIYVSVYDSAQAKYIDIARKGTQKSSMKE